MHFQLLIARMAMMSGDDDDDAGERGRAEDRTFLKKNRIRIIHERGETTQSEGGAVLLREAVRLSDGAFLMENNTKKNPCSSGETPHLPHPSSTLPRRTCS